MARKAVEPTTDEFVASLSGAYQSVAEEILSTLSFPQRTGGLAYALALVVARIPDLKMTWSVGAARWESWENALPELHAKAVALECQSSVLPKCDPTTENPWFKRHPAQPLLSFLHSDATFRAPDEPTKFRLNALRGVFLGAYAAERYGDLSFGNLDDLCNHVRRAYSGKGAFPLGEHLIPGPDKRETWSDSLKEIMGKRTLKRRFHGDGSPATFNWVVDLCTLLRHPPDVKWSPAVSVPKSERSLPPLPAEKLDPSEDEPSLIIEPDVDDVATTGPVPRTPRRRIRVVTDYAALEEIDAEALHPHITSAIELENVPAAEEAPIPKATAWEARHTSWRTAREAQRLPWDWEQLNPMEIQILTGAILAATGDAERLGAALAWFVLVTGQPLDAVLRFPWRSNLELLASPNRFPLAFKPFRRNPMAVF